MESLAAERNLRQLLFWNRFWLVLFGVALLIGTYCGVAQWAQERVLDVRSYRRGDDICFYSAQGGVAITHVQSRGLVAALQRPAFIVDSGKGCINVSELQNLDWRSDNGDRSPAPSPNSEFVGLYVRLERTKERARE